MDQKNLKNIIRNTKFEVENYVHRMDKIIKERKIESKYYDNITDYVLR